KLLAATQDVENRAGEAKLARERMANLAKERERLEEEMRLSSERQESLRKELAEINQRSRETVENRDGGAADLADTENKLNELEQSISNKEDVLERQKQSMIEAMNRLSDAKSRISRLEAIKGTLLERIEAIKLNQQDIREEGEKLNKEYDEVYGGFAVIKAEHDSRAQKKNHAVSRLNELNMALKQAHEDVRRMEQQIEAESSRIKVLQEMKRAYEGYYSSVRNLLRDAARDTSLGRCIEGVVAELIRVPQEYESAIEMTLGSALQNIVTPTENEGKRVIEYLRSKQYGRATMLPVSSMRSRLLSADEKAMCNVDGFIGVASDLVGFDQRYRGIFENLLGRTVIVKDLDAGIAINKRAHSSFRIATLKGDIINPGGSMTGGSVQKREFSLIGREREIEALSASVKEKQAALERSVGERQRMEADIEQANLMVEQLSRELHEKDIEMATHREKVDVVLKYVEDNRADMERSEMELSQIQDNIDNIDQQCAEADQDRSQWEQGNVASQEDIKKLQEELNALRAEQAAVNQSFTERRVAMMALEKEYAAAQGDIKRLERE
ncbi:MAG: hypothetical protein IJ941_03100, partial [Clostridia bacterium]|nr:hypothetical protein [Clostridia bacterium]